MSIAYEDLFHLNLSTLDKAIEAWNNTDSKLKSIERDYSDDVQKPFGTAGWESAGTASRIAAKLCKDIAAEVTRAQQVAEAIHGSLSKTRAKFQKHRKALRELVEAEAPKHHLKVSPTGIVSVQDAHASDEDAKVQQARVDYLADRITQVLDQAAVTDVESSRALSQIIGSASAEFASPSGTGVTGIQLASSGNGQGSIDIAPGPIPSLKPGNAPYPVREVTGLLSYRPFIEGSKLAFIHGKFPEGLSYAWEGVPPLALSYGAGKAKKFSPGRHRKPSFTNKVGKVGAKVLGLPVGIAATAFDYSLDITGKEKLFDW